MTRTLPTAPTAPTTSLAALAGCRSSRFGPRFDDPKGDDGVIDFSKLDDDQKKAIGTIVETQLNAALKPVIASVATLNEGLSTITERIENLPAPKGNDDKDNSAPKDGGDSQVAELIELVKKQNERLDAIDQEKQSAADSAAARKLAEAIVEKNHPGLKKEAKETLIKRIASAGPKSEEEADAARQSTIAEFRSMGMEEKAFGADAKGEGAEEPPKQETGDEIAQRRIKDLAGTGGSVGLADRAKPSN